MYQPYPSGSQMPEQPSRPVAPQPVLMAAKLMYVGAVLSALAAVYTAATAGSLKSAILKAHPLYTTAQVHTAERSNVISAIVVGGLLTTGLWIWMARMNGAGHKWARIVASALFFINTANLLLAAAEASSATTAAANTGIQVALVVLVWLAGLGAIVLLWRRESSQYMAAASAKDAAA